VTEPSEDPPFDPYRYGAPEHPVPPEFAPPGYEQSGYQPPQPDLPPELPQNPYAQNPYAPGPFAGTAGQEPVNLDKSVGGQRGPGSFGPQNPGPQNPYGQTPPGYGGYPQPGQQGYPPPDYPQQGQSPGYPPPDYPQQGYPPPPGYSYKQPGPGHGKAVAGLVLGILSIVFCWASFVDLLLLVPALIFSIMGLSEARLGRGGRGLAMSGLICTIAGVVLAIVMTIVWVSVANNIDCSVPHQAGTFSYTVCSNQ
jgi:hypothetical protein